MTKDCALRVAVRLCYADICCGYIAVNPITGNRNDMIKERLFYYYNKINEIKDKKNKKNISDTLIECAAELVAADIIGDSISLEPLLYDRDEEIVKRLFFYLQILPD